MGFVLAVGGLSLAELGVDAPGLGPSPAAAESPDGSASLGGVLAPEEGPLQVPLGRPYARFLRVGLRIPLRLRLRVSRRAEREEHRGCRIPDPRHPPGSLHLGPGDRLRGLGRVGPRRHGPDDVGTYADALVLGRLQPLPVVVLVGGSPGTG